MDRQSIAKTTRLLSLTLGRFFEYDYLWQVGEWVKADTRTIFVPATKSPKGKKLAIRTDNFLTRPNVALSH